VLYSQDCYRVQTHHFQRKQFLFFHSFNLLVLNNSTQLLYLHHAMCKRVKYFIYVGRVNSLFVLLLLSRYNNFILFFYKSFVCIFCFVSSPLPPKKTNLVNAPIALRITKHRSDRTVMMSREFYYQFVSVSGNVLTMCEYYVSQFKNEI
jgi:hypothetical protein